MEAKRCEVCGGKFIGDECPHCIAAAEAPVAVEPEVEPEDEE